MRAGRHFANAPGLGGSSATLSAEAAALVRARPSTAVLSRRLDPELLDAGRDLRLLGRGRRSDRLGSRRSCRRRSRSSATIFGTFPSWCTACRVSPAETAATPSRAAISFACSCVNVSCVPGRKKSCTKCVPALPSLERSVITAWFASTTSRPPPPPNGPESSWAVRVTVRSVPIPASGSSVALCASSSPFERLEITITRPTPTARPSSVRIVRPRRRRSSARRYRR